MSFRLKSAWLAWLLAIGITIAIPWRDRIQHDDLRGEVCMCFSATASFTVGGLLLPAGAYCVHSAWRKSPRHLALAAIPVGFGIQQISEGFVWLGLHSGDSRQITTASLAFLFFALAFWPFWIPFSLVWIEPIPWRRRVIAGLTAVGACFFCFLYLPVALEPDRTLTTAVAEHSIQYAYTGIPLYRWIAPELVRPIYLAIVAVPLALVSERRGNYLPALLLGGSALMCHLVFAHAFVSVWCFFAALVTGYLCYTFYVLPEMAHRRSTEAPLGGRLARQ